MWADVLPELQGVFTSSDWNAVQVLRCLNPTHYDKSTINIILLCVYKTHKFALKICTSEGRNYIVENNFAKECSSLHSTLFLKVFHTFRHNWKGIILKLRCRPLVQKFVDALLDNRDCIPDAECIVYEYMSYKNCMLLEEWATETHPEREWYDVLFQVFTGIHILQKRFPSFRHNDLLPQNIFLEKKSVNMRYGKIHFYSTLRVKIWDFECAHSKDEDTRYVNKCAINGIYRDQFLVNDLTIPQLDLHFLINILLRIKYCPPRPLATLLKSLLRGSDGVSYVGDDGPLYESRIQDVTKYNMLTWKCPKDLIEIISKNMVPRGLGAESRGGK